jgi:hypothetical protein
MHFTYLVHSKGSSSFSKIALQITSSGIRTPTLLRGAQLMAALPPNVVHCFGMFLLACRINVYCSVPAPMCESVFAKIPGHWLGILVTQWRLQNNILCHLWQIPSWFGEQWCKIYPQLNPTDRNNHITLWWHRLWHYSYIRREELTTFSNQLKKKHEDCSTLPDQTAYLSTVPTLARKEAS